MSEMQHGGWFITFEGPDGSGKTTQANLLFGYLKGLGYNVLYTREPGGTDIGDQIRAVLHSLQNKAMRPRAEVLLYMASRAQLVEEAILPHLACGGIVLCDRFFDSSLAYQGYGHRLDLDALSQLIAFATGGLRPDLTFYFDIEAEEGLRRRQAAARQGAEWNRLDEYALEFHQRVREGYHKLIAQEPRRWVVLDGSGPVEKVQEAVRREVMGRLAAGKG